MGKELDLSDTEEKLSMIGNAYEYRSQISDTISYSDSIRSRLKADCGNCSGLCCVALYFSTSDGFPADKAADIPCFNLQPDFCCSVHEDLEKLGLKGCISYDCLGAGQKTVQVTFGGRSWRQASEDADRKQVFEVFLMIKILHEMLWYLAEAYERQKDSGIRAEIRYMLDETERLTNLGTDEILKYDLLMHRMAVNALLKKTSEAVRKEVKGASKAKAAGKPAEGAAVLGGITSRGSGKTLKGRKLPGGGLDFIGADLRNKDLTGENLSGALLIAADLRGADFTGTDLIGADLRDADLRGADLTKSIYLTQAQINAAKGDASTKLPRVIVHPGHWER